ncbi:MULTISPECIES: iron-containing alcohol dehydrogenase [unclassified Roseovarius]|uniref:iron-containing alcohol dehydrogenase n=1 Tax=unclassified Roseovarius TaxID=2614913 RepID=UPI00273D2D6E|nr:iron-containing alcohol dehydrogenase [Roseovarius sp. MMSF_3350]
MTPFGLAAPTRILFGRGEFAKAVDLAAFLGPHAFVVHGATPRHATALLDAPGLEATGFACPIEPDLALLETALDIARQARATHVVAIGGGAAIDLGKAVAGLLNAKTSPVDHLEVVGRGQPLTTPPAPFMAIPTTAGTGAEATKNAVIGVPDHARKVSLRDAAMLADIALVDPALTDNTPKSVTLASGLDAVTQVIEPYVSSRANPLTDALCRAAIPRGLRALRKLMEGENADARDDMAFVSLTGGLALANAGLGAVHGLAGVIGGRVPTAPHGAVCGALLPATLAANFTALPKDSPHARRIAEIRVRASEALGTADIAAWSRHHGLPTLAQMGVAPADHAAIATEAQSSSSMAANPVELPVEVLQGILAAS